MTHSQGLIAANVDRTKCGFQMNLALWWYNSRISHYDDVIMGAIASLITSLTIVYSTVYSDADQRKHQSSASLAFVWGIHRGPVNSPHKWPVTRKMFPFDDVIMMLQTQICQIQTKSSPGTLYAVRTMVFIVPVVTVNFTHNIQDCHKTSNISRNLVGNKIVGNSDVVGASRVGSA